MRVIRCGINSVKELEQIKRKEAEEVERSYNVELMQVFTPVLSEEFVPNQNSFYLDVPLLSSTLTKLKIVTSFFTKAV